ncbi:aminodeoxychorismate synthase component I [Undibacterium sp.]|uniref:aminodeoxychorismate synthase component I n=1 Tax=Undibacterium sp. TaxID=1914977 RepID=UPI00272FECA2|nr:aminodeoxychorismate synthase component I [Undibacterium sp.]MDP1980104.1 aminodeoxychorismate synthase component I [Undibacterium sp.]
MSDFSNNPVLPFPLPQPEECFALLDDAHAQVAQSRYYCDLQKILVCSSAQEWPPLWREAELALQQGSFALAMLAYETGAQLQGIAEHPTPAVSRILLFRQCHVLDSQQVAAFLLSQTRPDEIAGIAGIQANVDASQFEEGLARVREYIAAGDTYQVNYTYRLHFDSYGTPLALYSRLRQRQPVPYGALICLPDGEAVVSLSPELFVRQQQGKLLARPMKGTAAATGDAEQDKRLATELAADSKNRAENLMIVDLLRNDLGRIAKTGTVRVPKLFEVNRFSSVLQMTSTVEADLQDGLNLEKILTALFPCGSITGAPKHRTMQIIRELEAEPRGLYTGAIGWFDPPAQVGALGDFCLSVPIRTLQLQTPLDDVEPVLRRGVLGVGAGIVYDSVASEEYAECHLKARFLTGLLPQFELFETMHATQEEGCRHQSRHLQRLKASAQYFGFAWDHELIKLKLQQVCDALPGTIPHRLRLALNPSGELDVRTAVLSPLPAKPKVMLASTTSDSRNLFLRHKSSLRQQYDQAWQAAEQQGAFDMLFFNERGHLTEGGRSTVLLKLEGKWLTPPLDDGVLPGIMRALLLEDRRYQLTEHNLTLADLQAAEQIMLCNSLRGAFVVDLIN